MCPAVVLQSPARPGRRPDSRICRKYPRWKHLVEFRRHPIDPRSGIRVGDLAHPCGLLGVCGSPAPGLARTSRLRAGAPRSAIFQHRHDDGSIRFFVLCACRCEFGVHEPPKKVVDEVANELSSSGFLKTGRFVKTCTVLTILFFTAVLATQPVATRYTIWDQTAPLDRTRCRPHHGAQWVARFAGRCLGRRSAPPVQVEAPPCSWAL